MNRRDLFRLAIGAAVAAATRLYRIPLPEPVNEDLSDIIGIMAPEDGPIVTLVDPFHFEPTYLAEHFHVAMWRYEDRPRRDGEGLVDLGPTQVLVPYKEVSLVDLDPEQRRILVSPEREPGGM